jgi:hypothetical protein
MTKADIYPEDYRPPEEVLETIRQGERDDKARAAVSHLSSVLSDIDAGPSLTDYDFEAIETLLYYVAPMFTPMTDGEYVKDNGANRCPYCRAPILVGEIGDHLYPNQVTRDTFHRKVSCPECDHQWEEIFELTGWQEL